MKQVQICLICNISSMSMSILKYFLKKAGLPFSPIKGTTNTKGVQTDTREL